MPVHYALCGYRFSPGNGVPPERAKRKGVPCEACEIAYLDMQFYREATGSGPAETGQRGRR